MFKKQQKPAEGVTEKVIQLIWVSYITVWLLRSFDWFLVSFFRSRTGRVEMNCLSAVRIWPRPPSTRLLFSALHPFFLFPIITLFDVINKGKQTMLVFQEKKGGFAGLFKRSASIDNLFDEVSVFVKKICVSWSVTTSLTVCESVFLLLRRKVGSSVDLRRNHQRRLEMILRWRHDQCHADLLTFSPFLFMEG